MLPCGTPPSDLADQKEWFRHGLNNFYLIKKLSIKIVSLFLRPNSFRLQTPIFYQTNTNKSENSPTTGRQVITMQAEGRLAFIMYHYAGYQIVNQVRPIIIEINNELEVFVQISKTDVRFGNNRGRISLLCTLPFPMINYNLD